MPKERRGRIIKKILCSITLVLLSFLFLTINVNATEDYENGYIDNSIVTLDKTNETGGVKIVKKLTKQNDEGLYKVSFEVSGKEVTITNQKSVYVVVVFDRSGSMLCPSGTTKSDNGTYEYNGQKLKCTLNENMNINKWTSAVDGAIKFSGNLIKDISTAKLSLITFGSDVSSATNFASTTFETSQFLYPYGGTNLDSAIENAKEKLDDVNNPKVVKYMIIISDGEPDDKKDAIDEATKAKNHGITIYSIGYEANGTNKETLKSISSNNTCYEASSTAIEGILKNISDDITKIPAGTEAVLKDTIGDDFTFVSSDDPKVIPNNKLITYNLGTLTEEPKSFEYLIKLTLPTNTEWHNTNAGVILTYKDYNSKNKSVSVESTPRVYWITKYSYTVNYYVDSVSSENFRNKYSGSDRLNASIESIDDMKFINEGEIVKEVIGLPLTITSQESDNVINVVYEKNNKITYTVEYYYDDVLDSSKTLKYENQLYGSVINAFQDKSGADYKLKSSNIPYTLGLDNNIIKVYYEKIVVNEGEIVPPKTGIEEKNDLWIYATSLLLVLLKKRLF